MQKPFQILLLFFLFFCFSLNIFAQGSYITVLDRKTKEPVPFAHVCFESPDGRSQEHEITDVEGRVLNKATSQNTKISISFIGFESYESTIRPSVPETIYLEPEIFNVGETVVTGQYTPEKADKSIYKVQVIGAKQIEEKGANNLGELLGGESNIQIKQDGVLGTSLKMQGLSGENVKILVDGVPIIGRMNGNIDLGQIDLSNVDHVEIVEGPMSVIYGTNALAGTINIITKENKRNNFFGQFNNYYESVGVYNVDASASVKKNTNTLSLAGGRNFTPAYSFNENIRTPTFKPKEQYKAKADYAFSKGDTKIKLNSTLFKEKIQHLGKIDTLLAFNSIIANDQYFYTTRLTNSLNFDQKINNADFINILGAYSTYTRTKNTLLKDFSTLDEEVSTDLSRHDTTTFTSLMLRGTYSHDNKESKLTYQLGFDVNVDDGSGKRINDSVSTRMDDYALFVSSKYKIFGESIIQPGLRLIHNTKFDAPLIPTINIKWQALPDLNLRLSYAKGFRAPSLKELYLDFVDANHNIHGNTDLKSETNDSYNFSVKYGFDIEKHAFETEGSFFYNDGKDVIALIVVDPVKLFYKNENIDIRKTTGGRLNLNYNYYPHLTIKTGFSLTGISETLTLPDSNLVSIGDSSHYEYFDKSFLSDYQFTEDFNLNLSYRFINYDLLFSVFYKYNGKTTALYTDIDEDTDEEFINRYTVEAYHGLDVSFTRKFYKNRLTVVLGAKNLFDNKTLLTSTGYNPGAVHGGGAGGSTPIGWGRSYFIRLNYKFARN